MIESGAFVEGFCTTKKKKETDKRRTDEKFRKVRVWTIRLLVFRSFKKIYQNIRDDQVIATLQLQFQFFSL